MSLYRLDDKTLGRLLSESPEEILRASSYEIDDALLRLSSEDFEAFIKKASREVFRYLAMSVSSEGALVLFFRLPEDEVGRFITSLRPKALSRFISLLIDSVSPDIVIRRLDENTLQIVLDSLEENILSAFILGLSMHSLRRVLPHGGVLLQVSPEARKYILSAYRMGDMQRWGVYLTQSILSDIDKDSWAILAPRLSGKDWNTLFTALDEEKIIRLLKMLDRRTLKRLIRRIDKELFMSFLLSASDKLADIMDITLIDEIVSGSALDVSMTLHLYKTDKKRAVSILKRIPPSLMASYIKEARLNDVKMLADVLKREGMLEDVLFALPAEASFRLYKVSGEKEVYPSLLLLHLTHGLSIWEYVPISFICKFLSTLDVEHLSMIPPSEVISRCIVKSGAYKMLPNDVLWRHILMLPPSDEILKHLDVAWTDAPAEVFKKHRALLSKMLMGIPDGLLLVMFEDDVPEDADEELVRRWSYLPDVPLERVLSVLAQRKMWSDMYKIMKTRGILPSYLIPEVFGVADADFIDDVLMMGYGDKLFGLNAWDRLSTQQKAMVLVSAEPEKRRQILEYIDESQLWDIIMGIDDMDILRAISADMEISADSLVRRLKELTPSSAGILADRVDDISLLFKMWPEGVYYSKRMQDEAHKYIDMLPDKEKAFLICSGQVSFSDKYASAVDYMSEACIEELREVWPYLEPQRLYRLLISHDVHDKELWLKVYREKMDISPAPLSVRVQIWRETGDCSLFSDNELMSLVEEYEDVARCLSVQMWQALTTAEKNIPCQYVPEEVLTVIDEKSMLFLIKKCPDIAKRIVDIWPRERALHFLVRYAPEVFLSVVKEKEVEDYVPYMDTNILKRAITLFPHTLWRYICQIEDDVSIAIPGDIIDDENILQCIVNRGITITSPINIPVKPETMKMLWKSGLVSENAVKRSLQVYGDMYVDRGYIPDTKCISALQITPSPERIQWLVDSGFWEYVPEDKRLEWLFALDAIPVKRGMLTEHMARILLKAGKISPLDIVKIGFSHLLEDNILSCQDAIALYRQGYISIEEAYRLSGDVSCFSPSEIDELLKVADVDILVPYEIIPLLSSHSIYTLLRRGHELSADVLPDTFVRWLVSHEEYLAEVVDMLPQRTRKNIIEILENRGGYTTDVFWKLWQSLDAPLITDMLSAPSDMWKYIPPRLLVFAIGIYGPHCSVILPHVSTPTLKEALMDMSETDVMAISYLIRDRVDDILCLASPQEVVDTSLKVFVPLISDKVLDKWIKQYPEDTYSLIKMPALLYTVKNPCILEKVSDEGVRRLFDVAPEDISLEIIARSYNRCRDVSGRLIQIYASKVGLRPSEIMLRAGLVPGK